MWLVRCDSRGANHVVRIDIGASEMQSQRMTERLEATRGSGNAYRDLKRPYADVEQLKALLAAEIIKRMDKEGLSTRAAHAKTGIAAADFSRIRNADLSRFTVDRLMAVINLLGARVDVAVKVRVPRAA